MVELAAEEGQSQGKNFLAVQVYVTQDQCFLGSWPEGQGIAWIVCMGHQQCDYSDTLYQWLYKKPNMVQHASLGDS